MAVNSRTEADNAVDIALVPTLTLTQHKALLKDNINSSTVFRKDVIASETPSVGAVTADFSDKDLATITTAVDLVVSFSNIENGDIKTLGITKNVTNEITFSGATDVSPRKAYIISDITYVEYEVRNKNGIITVNSKNIDNDITSQITGIESDIIAVEADIVTIDSDIVDINNNIVDISGGLDKKIENIGNWNMDSITGITVPFPSGVTLSNIQTAKAFIINDSGSTKRNLEGDANENGPPDGSITFNAAGIFLGRRTTGFFDGTDYNSDPYNRGTVVIEYIP